MNRIQQLISEGQSVWLDFTQRSFVAQGELGRFIAENGVTGVTSNPTIFDEAISQTKDYAEALAQAAARGLTGPETYESLAIEDIRAVADELAGVYEKTGGQDGFVSLEVSPHFAREIERTTVQARSFWERVGRPNLMIKVPGTREGLVTLRRLIAEGINVNVTLLFSLHRYEAVADAYMSGLEDRLAAKLPIANVASVASFFVSRIDSLVDPLLQALASRAPDPAPARALQGRAAIANAKRAYALYRQLLQTERFHRLRDAGARPQRILWASTGTKNPAERDVRYVEALLGPDTVTTLSRPTLEAFIDHGNARPQLSVDLHEADAVISGLGRLGIDIDVIAQQLEEEGVQKFARAFDHLGSEIERKLSGARKAGGNFWGPDIAEKRSIVPIADRPQPMTPERPLD